MSGQSASTLIKRMKYLVIENLMNDSSLLNHTLGDIREYMWENATIQQHYITPLFGKIGKVETRNQFNAIVENCVDELGGCMEDTSNGRPTELEVYASTGDDAIEVAERQVGFAIESCKVRHAGADKWLVSNIVWEEDCEDSYFDEEDEYEDEVCPYCHCRNCKCYSDEDESGFVAPPLY